MSKNTVILKWLLFVGAIYFLGISIVHTFGIKVPLLYIYFTVPSYAYQDRIISFLALGWSVFLFTAFIDPVKNRDLVRAVHVAGVIAIIGLSVINSTTDFHALSPKIQPASFWKETFGLGIYVVLLGFFSYRVGRENADS
jgi:hypothetical protein